MLNTLKHVHTYLRERSLLQRFTLLTRTLLAFGFIAPGLTKVVGRHFAPGIDPAHPMGAYFVAFHGTGAYYAFVGLVQLTAGLLLLSRRTALLGACLYFPIIINIFALVTATRFGVGTPVMAGLMTLACLWLITWDAHRIAPLLSRRALVEARAMEPAVWDVLAPLGAQGWIRHTVRLGYIIGFAGGLALTLFTRDLGPEAIMPISYWLFAVVSGGFITLAGWVFHGLQGRAVPRAL